MNKEQILKELKFKYVRSSGPGGQHVNKVASKVLVFFDLQKSDGLDTNEKNLIASKLSSRLTKDLVLIMECDENRSQIRNKEKVISRLVSLLKKGCFVAKKRLSTKPSKSSVKRNLEQKKRRGEIKKNRMKPRI